MKQGDCRHFNGTQNGVCKAGINYRALAGEPEFGWGTRLPCLPSLKYPEKDKATKATCNQFSEITAQEQAEFDTRVAEKVAAFSKALVEGRCPQCGEKVERRQVGHCVYGSCGHRLYQGKA